MKKRKFVTAVVALLLSLAFSSIGVQADETPNNNPVEETAVIPKVSQKEYLTNVADLSPITTQEFRNSLLESSINDEYIYIGRETCYYCRQFSPVIKEFNLMINQQLKYYNTDSDTFGEEDAEFIFNEIGIPGTPTILHIINGKIVAGWIGGGVDANQLKTFFDEHLTLN
ncbi:MAG TPA: thioredoxin family protein [Enterococcus columbae]|nr:thioredoxin family protein [Enterococcus columbae]